MVRYITESKYPERQFVLDYMDALGIRKVYRRDC